MEVRKSGWRIKARLTYWKDGKLVAIFPAKVVFLGDKFEGLSLDHRLGVALTQVRDGSL